MSNHLVCSIAAHKSVSGQLFQCSWITRPKGMLHGFLHCTNRREQQNLHHFEVRDCCQFPWNWTSQAVVLHLWFPVELQTWRDKWEDVFCATTGSTACMLQSTWHFASFLNWFTFSNIKYQQNFSLKFKIKSYSAFLLPFLKEYHSGIWCNKTDLVIQYPM